MNLFGMKFNNKLVFLLAFAAMFIMNACKDDFTDWKKLREGEIADRNEYLAKNHITTKPKESGLYYIEVKKGSGLKPNEGRNVTVKYKGKFLNGEVFEESDSFSFPFGSQDIIKGWNEGIGYMRKGGKATLIIPSSLAYGPRGDQSGTIPKYSTLIFDIELLNVQ